MFSNNLVERRNQHNQEEAESVSGQDRLTKGDREVVGTRDDAILLKDKIYFCTIFLIMNMCSRER